MTVIDVEVIDTEMIDNRWSQNPKGRILHPRIKN